MKTFTISFLILLIHLTGHGQVPFEKEIGSSNWNEIGLQTLRLSGGDLLMMGNINSDSVNADVLLIRMSQDGQQVKWQKAVGTPGKDFGNAMLYDSFHQSLFVLGKTTEYFNSSTDGMMMRLDTSGNLIWLKTFGDSIQNENIKGADFHPEFGIGFTGFTTAPAGTKNNVWSGMIDTSGAIIWDRLWSTPENEVGNDAKLLPDGSLAIAGDQFVDPFGYDIIVARYSATGDSLWEIGIRDEVNGGSQEMILSKNGDLLISGESGTPTEPAFDVTLSRVDTAGIVRWHRFLPGTPFGEAGFSLIQPDDRHLIISGYGYSDSTQNSEAYVWLADTAANLLQQKFYGDVSADIGYHLLDDGNGWFYLTGLTGSTDNQILFVHDYFDLSPQGLMSPVKAENLSIYPNPSSGNSIKLSEHIGGTITLTHLSGKVAWRESVENGTAFIPSHLSNGVYLIKVTSNSKIYLGKLYLLR